MEPLHNQVPLILIKSTDSRRWWQKCFEGIPNTFPPAVTVTAVVSNLNGAYVNYTDSTAHARRT